MSLWSRTMIGLAVTCLGVLSANAQKAFSDTDAIMQFQRTADAYAFQHRQVQRRLGEGADRKAMAAALRAARAVPAEGSLFTPAVAAAFRFRIDTALRTVGCEGPEVGDRNFTVLRPNDDAAVASSIPECVKVALPRLPEELEYRTAGVTLVLVDIHAGLAVDVLHAAFSRRDN